MIHILNLPRMFQCYFQDGTTMGGCVSIVYKKSLAHAKFSARHNPNLTVFDWSTRVTDGQTIVQWPAELMWDKADDKAPNDSVVTVDVGLLPGPYSYATSRASWHTPSNCADVSPFAACMSVIMSRENLQTFHIHQQSSTAGYWASRKCH